MTEIAPEPTVEPVTVEAVPAAPVVAEPASDDSDLHGGQDY
jgi:hypothetical protein